MVAGNPGILVMSGNSRKMYFSRYIIRYRVHRNKYFAKSVARKAAVQAAAATGAINPRVKKLAPAAAARQVTRIACAAAMQTSDACFAAFFAAVRAAVLELGEPPGARGEVPKESDVRIGLDLDIGFEEQLAGQESGEEQQGLLLIRRGKESDRE